MSKASRYLGVLAAAMMSAGLGCSDTTAPASAPLSVESKTSNDLLGLGGLLGTLTNLLVPPVTRNTPLPNDVVWTFTAGPDGALSANSAVGLTIVVPPGALASTQTITVTALKGSAVAYGFEPHLQFDRKVVLTQNLRGTSAGGLLSLNLTLSGAHFDGDAPSYSSGGLAIVSEVVPSLTSLLTKTTSFGVSHFSGWIVASGRSQ
ncbi:MAG TPA: hypothetical protein VJ867_11240 [Gemmatimonadaceae bacterium]|nr:hypothetical protein [Gemmatimonadaceae bacterium]